VRIKVSNFLCVLRLRLEVYFHSSIIRPKMHQPLISKAGPPFDRPDADIILRSTDGVEFHTFKSILSLASQFFNDMYEIPQPLSTTGD